MMCSNWKISVYGIVALMLAFGLATTDAGAADPSDVSVIVSADGGTVLRAAQEGRILTFVLSLSNTAADKDGKIQIIPHSTRDGWTSPRLVATGVSLADEAAAGSVSFVADGPTGTVGSGVLTANVSSGYSGTITWQYKTNIGFKAKNHKFRIKSTVHKDKGPQLTVSRTGAGTEGDAYDYTGGNIQDAAGALIDDAATFADNGNNIVIIVGAALSGSGTFALTTTGIPKGPGDYENDGDDAIDNYSRENQYIVTAEREYNLTFTYTAAGTMHKGSVIRFDIPNDGQTLGDDDAEDWPEMTDGSGAGRLVVSGATLFSFERGGDNDTDTRDTAAAYLSSRMEKGHTVKFTYTTKTPKVVAASDATYLFTAYTISPPAAVDDITLANAPTTAPGVDDALPVAGVTFVVVQGQGGGTLAVTPDADIADPADHGTNISPSTDDSAAANLRLTFTAAGRMLQGSQVTVAIPNGWTPAPRTSRVQGSTENGIVTAAVAQGTDNSALQNILTPLNETTVAVNNRQITVTLEEGELVAGDTIVITYSGVKQPATGGINTFAARSSSYKGEALKALAADKIPTINVVAGDGSGSIVLMKDGQRFGRTTRKTEIPDLRFVYTPAGHLPKGTKVQIHIPAGWTQPIEDNTNGTVEAGEVRIAPSDKATLALPTPVAADGTGSAGWNITATSTKVIGSSDKLTITYKKVTTPDVDPRSDVFNTRVDIDGDATVATDGTLVSPSPTVGIGQAPDGAGTMTVNMPQVNAGDPLGDLVFTYVAAGDMTFGAIVQLAIDPDWPAAIAEDAADPTKTGTTTLSGDGDADPTITDDGYTVTATLNTAISLGDTVIFTYKNITAPSVAGSHTFTASSQHTSIGILTALDESPSINVSVRAAGTVVLATPDGPLPSIQPGDALGNLQFTFSAGARMEIGSEVEIVIPAGWTRASEDNGDAVVIPGEVALAATDPATLEVTANADGSYTVTATATGVLLVNETLTFTYQEVTAPAEEGPYNFASRVSAVAGGTLLPIDDSPQVVVRTVPTTLTLTASSDSFFVGDSITLTVDLDARTPAGGLDVALTTDPANSGTFSMTEDGDAVTSVPIADSADSMSAMVYYTNDVSGAVAVTLTATAGELTDSASVVVKSTIRDLAVDIPIAKQGSTITVTATGRAGSGTVTILDADGDKVGTKKSLDPVGDVDPDGDQEYSRSIELPASLVDGMYTLSVEIEGDTNKSLSVRVLNDQAAPTLSNASALPVQATYAMNGNQVVLSVTVTLNESMIAIASVVADTATLDSENPEIKLEDPDGDGVYNSIFTISSMGNTNGDGPKVVSFTATDDVKNVSDALTASITLRNDLTAPTLSMASAMPSPVANGDTVTISVNGGESGLTVTADASAIGGGTVTLTEGMMAANGMTNGMDANGMTNGMANGMDANGMDANGMTNGMDANGMTNGMDANGMTNGMDANGMTNGMDANGMADAAPGNGMYTGMATVTGATDGAQMITITATDASGNSRTATVSVMIDNTGPALSMASADPAMAANETVVTISVSTESGATVTADASAIGGDAAVSLAEGMDADMAGTGMYSAMVTVTEAMDGDQMVSISGTDALGNASEAASVTVTVDNTAPALSAAAITPDWALNGDTVTISVNGGESGLTVTTDASAIGGDAALALAEGMDADMAGTGMYSADVTVTDAMGGDQTVSISASDAIGNASEAVSATVSIHVVTSASFSPADVSTGDTVMVSAMGTAGLTATFNVFDAEATNIVTDGMLTESADAAGSYSGSFDVVVDAHPTGTYWVTATIGQASMTAEGALTIDHKAQFDLAIAAGTHLIHVPLDVTHINGVEGTIGTVGDLYDALGTAVNFIISLGADGTWNSYLGDESAGGVADAAIGDDTGLIAVMSSAASLKLAGNALGTGGTSAITLGAGNNLVGVPLDGDLLSMISDALSPLVSAVVVSNEAGNGFQTIAQAGDPGDGAIMGGVGYIVVAAATASIPIVGVAWDNTEMMMMADAAMIASNGASTAPSIGFQTPVLQVQGRLIDVSGMMSRDGLNVTVRNLTRGSTLGSTTATDDYSMTFVKLDSSAAKVGDVIEINADSPNPLLGIRPVQHVVTADDVIDSRIDLPDLVTYEIPAQTELLANYPNPFNPETWIPYRLAEDGNVALSIYGASGSLVRTIDIGFTPAAVYEGRSDAIYWDGRNNFGEQVSSGIYFYHLNAGDFSATRKMVIVK